jgi:hypothetical protein
MLVYKTSLLIQVNTAPVDRNYATPHAGGWSEGVWSESPLGFQGQGAGIQWANRRSFLLPIQCTITGYRNSVYDLTANKLTPRGTSAGKLIYPGNNVYTAGNPQAGLELGWPANAGPNNSRIVLRGLPDEVIVNGEFNGNSGFRSYLNQFTNVFFGQSFGWVGRDLSQPSATVNLIGGNVVTLSQALAGVVAGNFLRFRKVRNDAGQAIKGSYLITNVAGAVYTLQGLAGGALTKPNGTARNDVVGFITGGRLEIGRAVVKKIGRPFESYRGRRSKMRA